MKSVLYFLFSLLSFSSLSWAQEGIFTHIHHLYQAPRALGMGGAFVAVADDYSTLFYNPAGLARLEEGQLNLSIDAAISGQQIASLYNQLKDASNSSNDATAKFNAYYNVPNSNYGKQYTVRAGLLEGVYVRPGWGVALIPADLTLDLRIENQVTPALNMRGYLDSTFALGFGGKIKSYDMPGRLAWGVSGKFVRRGFVDRQINSLDLLQNNGSILQASDLRYGYTIDSDVGFLFSPTIGSDDLFSFMSLAKPTFGIVAHNIFDTGFAKSLPGDNKTPVSPPERLYRTYDFGTKFEFPSLWIFAARAMIDITDIGHPNFNWRKGTHLGYEFDWRVASWWKGQYRIGVNQGYMTLGASALFALFRLDLVSYSEDIGSYDSPRENRLYMVKLNIDW